MILAQHFLLTAKAKTLSLAAVLRLADDEAFQTFKECRWEGGEPVCPKCGSATIYTYAARRIFKCKDCKSQFSVTSGTIFADRKLAIRDYLAAIALFVNGAKGVSMLQMGRDLNVSYKTIFVLCHKLREAMASEQLTWTMEGEVEVDGAYFGGTIRQENKRAERVDRRKLRHQNGKRRAVVVMRERRGRTLPFVFKSEAESVRTVAERVKPGAKVYADEAAVWDQLHAIFDMKRVNHSVEFADNGVCTNQAESYFARLRRSELGVHHHFSAQHLHQYAGEMAWREDHRRVSNGEQFTTVTKLALAQPVSRKWSRYWGRK
jgi:transposase-like protein